MGRVVQFCAVEGKGRAGKGIESRQLIQLDRIMETHGLVYLMSTMTAGRE